MRDEGFARGFMYVLLVFMIVGLGILIFFNYQANAAQQAQIEAAEIAAATTPTPPPTPTPAPTPTPTRNVETVTLAAAGDIVAQPGLTTDAEVTEGDTVTYDYSEELAGAAPSLEGADFAVCTLVGTLSARGPYDASYRMDAALATALAGTGFRLVNGATDHILDFGLDGLTATLNALGDEGLAAAGIYRSSAMHGAYLADIHGVQVAFLSYTYGTGGVSVVDNPWCVDILTQDYMTGQTAVDYERIDSDIAAVRAAGADVVVTFVYWWDNTQYYTQTRESQTEVAEHLMQSGADIILGGGVKTPQPIEVHTVERADGTKANCVVCYSLSNLMSCFNDRYTNLAATARIEISRDTDTGETWISGVSYCPLFMLDTGDYADYTDPGYKYRVLDAYAAIDDYENGGESITASVYDAILTGVSDLQSILGAEYDVRSGGVAMDFPY